MTHQIQIVADEWIVTNNDGETVFNTANLSEARDWLDSQEIGDTLQETVGQ